MVDLRAVFYNCFKPVKPDIGKGTVLSRGVKGTSIEYAIRLPKKYTEKTPWGAILTLLVLVFVAVLMVSIFREEKAAAKERESLRDDPDGVES